MCDVLSALGTGLKAYGALQEGQTKSRNDMANAEFASLQADAFNNQAAVATTNLGLLRTQAEIAKGNVDIAEAKGALDQSRVTLAGDKTLIAQRVNYSYRNIDPAYGSPLVLAGKTAATIETDIGLVRASTAIAKAGALTGVANIEQSAFGQSAAAVTASQNALLSFKKAGVYAGNAGSDLWAGEIGAGTAVITGIEDYWTKVAKAAAA